MSKGMKAWSWWDAVKQVGNMERKGASVLPELLRKESNNANRRIGPMKASRKKRAK